ncbi:MAG: hypothetical protein MR738_09860, partial [Enterocloster clostridioformis]|nr:hypothetical protein [Enterocloster clostridioformis]
HSVFGRAALRNQGCLIFYWLITPLLHIIIMQPCFSAASNAVPSLAEQQIGRTYSILLLAIKLLCQRAPLWKCH